VNWDFAPECEAHDVEMQTCRKRTRHAKLSGVSKAVFWSCVIADTNQTRLTAAQVEDSLWNEAQFLKKRCYLASYRNRIRSDNLISTIIKPQIGRPVPVFWIRELVLEHLHHNNASILQR
jgi:hypothetical protein